jgi:hypothetical protein
VNAACRVAGALHDLGPRTVWWPSMTDIQDDVISEALEIIDRALGQMASRELLSSDEVADLLLDVRTLLAAYPGDDAERVPAASN